MVLFESVLEAVSPVASCAVYALDAASVNQCFTRGVGALLLMVEYCRLGQWLVISRFSVFVGLASCPFTSFGTLMRVLGAVVEAKLAGVVSTAGLDSLYKRLTLDSSRNGMVGNLVHGNTPSGSAPR